MPDSVDSPAPESTTTSPSATSRPSASTSSGGTVSSRNGAALTRPSSPGRRPRAGTSPFPRPAGATTFLPVRTGLRVPTAGARRPLRRPVQAAVLAEHLLRLDESPAVEEDLAVAEAAPPAQAALQPGGPRHAEVPPAHRPAERGVAAE